MKKLLTLALAATFLASSSLPIYALAQSQPPAFDAAPGAPPAASAPMVPATPLATCFYGQVTAVDAEKLQIKEHRSDKILSFRLTAETYLVDALSGLPLAKGLQVGDGVAAYYLPEVTEGVPAQSQALITLMANIPQDMAFPTYAKIEKVEKTGDDLTVTIHNGSALVTLGKDMPIAPFKTKNLVTLQDVKVGSEVVLWYSVMTASYPGMAQAQKAVILGTPDQTPPDLMADKLIFSLQAGVAAVNGREVTLDGQLPYEKNGVLLLPVRTLAQSLGYSVAWQATTNTVELKRGAQRISCTIGNHQYSLNKAPVQLLMAPEIFNGNTYVPSTFFEELLNTEVVINRNPV